MCETRAGLLSSIEALVDRLDVEAMTAEQSKELVSWFCRLERLAVAGKTLCAGRFASSGQYRQSGERSAASWLANETGDSVHNAINLLETADKLKQLPVLEDALRHGELSGLMTAIAAGAAAEDPGKQKALLEQARNGSVGDLRREAEHIRAAARSEQDAIRAYEAIKAKRSLRWWTDSEGAFRLDGRLTPDAGARLIAEIQPEARRVFRQARDDKAREPFGAYVADALVNLVTGVQLPGASTVSGAAWPPAPSCGGAWPLGPSPASEPSASQGPNAGSPPSGSGGAGSPGGAGQDPGSPDSPAPRAGAGRRTSHSVILRVDLAALRRGELGQGEVCEIPGVGPVPLAVARQLLGDAFLKLVITDGVDVQSVCHIGLHRHRPERA
jgi:hypothetical protein